MSFAFVLCSSCSPERALTEQSHLPTGETPELTLLGSWALLSPLWRLFIYTAIFPGGNDFNLLFMDTDTKVNGLSGANHPGSRSQKPVCHPWATLDQTFRVQVVVS